MTMLTMLMLTMPRQTQNGVCNKTGLELPLDNNASDETVGVAIINYSLFNKLDNSNI